MLQVFIFLQKVVTSQVEILMLEKPDYWHSTSEGKEKKKKKGHHPTRLEPSSFWLFPIKTQTSGYKKIATGLQSYFSHLFVPIHTSRYPLLPNRGKTYPLSLKVPNVEFNYDVSVASRQLTNRSIKVEFDFGYSFTRYDTIWF